MRFVILLWLMMPLTSVSAWSVLDFLTPDLDASKTLVQFKVLGPPPHHAICAIHWHFLSSNDCASGYLHGAYVDDFDHCFEVTSAKPFAILNHEVFQLVKSIHRDDEIDAIRSVLIRFRNANPEYYPSFARFMGACNNEDINCCLPIRCDKFEERCMVQQQRIIEPIAW